MHVMPLAFSWEALEAVGTNGCGQEAHPLEMIFGHLRNCHSITLPSCSPLCLGHALLLCFPKGLGPTLKAKQMYRAGTRYAVCPVIRSHQWYARLPTLCSSWEAPSMQPHWTRTWYRHCCTASLTMETSEASQLKCAFAVQSIKVLWPLL